jgi:flagellar hook-length control protein FliK
MIAQMMPPSTGTAEAGAGVGARRGGTRAEASAHEARAFERSLRDARERSDAGPRRSDDGGAAGTEKARAAHRATTADHTSEPAAAEPTTAATTAAGPSTSGTSGTEPTDAAATAAADDAATATGDAVALAAGTVAGAGLSTVSGQATSTTSGTATSTDASLGANTSVSATGATVLSGAGTAVVATGINPGDMAGQASSTASVAGQPASPAQGNASSALAGLTITVDGESGGSNSGPGVTASSGSPASTVAAVTAAAVTGSAVATGTATATTALVADPLIGPARASDTTTSSAAGQLGAVATPASGVPALTPTSASAGSAPIPQWLQQAVQAQLTGRLVAAARGGDAGSVQRLTVHLHPADLGAVQVIATMDDGTVSLQLLAGSSATRDALRASLGALRSDLAAAGLDGTRLDVSDQPPSQQGTAQHQSGAASDGSGSGFTGSRADGQPTMAGHRGTDRAPRATAGADVRPAPPGTTQGVDLRL